MSGDEGAPRDCCRKLAIEVAELRQHLAGLESAEARREEFYRALVENADDIMYSATPDGALTYLGRQASRYGLDPDRVLRDGVLSVIVPEDRERVMAELEEAIVTGREFPTRFRIQGGDGRQYWLEDRGKVVRDQDGNPSGVWGVLRDVTDQVEAEQALRRSEERFRLLVERSSDVVFELDADLRITFISPSVERISGLPAEQHLGRHYLDFMPEVNHERVVAVVAAMQNGESFENYQLTMPRPDGRRVSVEVNVAPIVRDGALVAFHGIVRDVSARVELEEQIRQMQKMEAIGTLAGGVAHDFNNLLTGILGYANLLKNMPDERVVRSARVIESAAERAAELTQQLLGFARRGKLQNRPVDVHHLVDEVAALLARTSDRRIVMVRRLEARRPVVTGDPGQLQQVVLNLAVNARDAMPEGGELTLATREQAVDRSFAQRHPELSPRRYLVVTVGDTGVGMTDEVRARIFEPFFTTKEKGRGTGMGLATAYGIIKNHDGAVLVDSTPGSGTIFEVYLPQAAELPAQDETGPHLVTGDATGRVLVVDDEEVIHEVARGMLEPLGYQVVGARNGQEAINYYRANRDRVDVVLLDLTMPVMDGTDCFRYLRQIDPDVRAVLSTGHGLDGAAQHLIDQGVTGFVQKPYIQAQLAAAIEDALRAPVRR